MGIKESAQTFYFAIKSTKEFNHLIHAKTVIEKNDLLKYEVIEFNKKLSSIYMSNKKPNAIKSEVEQLCNHYGNLTENEDVINFLQASDAFNEMVYRTNQYINGLIQKEIVLK